MVNEFAKLVCGASGSAGSFGGVTAHLSTSVKVVISEILKLPAESPERIALFGPFLGRSVVELTYTALVGRLDPFRLLALREIQMEQTAGDAAALTDAKIAVLRAASITTVGELASATDAQLDALDGVGPAVIRRFRNVVGQAIWM
jgi:hypothetical protein